MRVEFQVTGSSREAVRGAAARQLDALDPAADWQVGIDVSPAFRLDAVGGFDWCGDVEAWDGEDTAPARLRLLDDE